MKISEKKISAEFSSQLTKYGPKKKIRAIVVLYTKEAKKNSTRQELRANREAIIGSIRKSTLKALPDIDNILKENNGKRLSEGPDALGCVPVETTPDGIRALANSNHIKAILEDQPVSFSSLE